MTKDHVATPESIAIHRPERAIDITNSAALRDELLAQIENGTRTFVVDLSDVRYVDSSGLSSMVHVATTLEKSNGRIVLCGLDPSVRKVLEMTRLTEYFDITEDLEGARARAAELDLA